MDSAQRFARVLASAIWGWLAVLMLKYLGVEFSPEQADNIHAAMLVFFTAAFNALIGLASKKWPWVEWLLLSATKPRYLTLVERTDIGHALMQSRPLTEAVASKGERYPTAAILEKLEV